jgi:hypothetical protein
VLQAWRSLALSGVGGTGVSHESPNGDVCPKATSSVVPTPPIVAIVIIIVA